MWRLSATPAASLAAELFIWVRQESGQRNTVCALPKPPAALCVCTSAEQAINDFWLAIFLACDRWTCNVFCKPNVALNYSSSCTFGKYYPPSRDFLGGKIMSLEVNLDPGSCGVNAGTREFLQMFLVPGESSCG